MIICIENIKRDLNKLLKLVSGFGKAVKHEWYKNGQLRFYIFYLYTTLYYFCKFFKYELARKVGTIIWKVLNKTFTYNNTKVSFLTYKTDKNFKTNQRNSEVLEKDILHLVRQYREKYGKI